MHRHLRTFRRLSLFIVWVLLINLGGGVLAAAYPPSRHVSDATVADTHRQAPTSQYEDDLDGPGAGRLDLPEATYDTFVTSVTSPYQGRAELDNGRSFSFEIALDRYVPNLTYPDTQYYIGPNGFSDMDVHASMVANGILPEYVMLKLAVYDVDYPLNASISCPEVTEVMVNYNWIYDHESSEVSIIKGENNLWTLSEIRIPTRYLRLPEISWK